MFLKELHYIKLGVGVVTEPQRHLYQLSIEATNTPKPTTLNMTSTVCSAFGWLYVSLG